MKQRTIAVAAIAILCVTCLLVPVSSHAGRCERPGMSGLKMVDQASIKGNQRVLHNPGVPCARQKSIIQAVSKNNLNVSGMMAGGVSKITGRVTGPDCKTPLKDIYVEAYSDIDEECGGGWGEAYTAADGTYEIGGLPAGTYKVQFYDFDETYADQYYDNQVDPDFAREIVLGDEETVDDINACLKLVSKITGRVTGPDCTTPLEGIEVQVSSDVFIFPGWHNSTETAEDGTYEFSGLSAGTYKIAFYDPGGNYAGEAYDNQISRDSAKKIVVGAAATVADIDACLDEASSMIAGTVTGPDCTTPLEYIYVVADGDDGWGETYTDEDGTYKIGGLRAGKYNVAFYDDEEKYASEFYDNQKSRNTAREIAVGDETIVEGINACLDEDIPAPCSGDGDCDQGTTCDEGRCIECMLGNALDAVQLTWNTPFGAKGWFCQTEEFYYGGSAAQSGVIKDDGLSEMTTTVDGPAVVSFYWKVSSEFEFDYLSFYIDSVKKSSISGTVDWQRKEYSLPAGTHTLKWLYSKDDSASSCLDHAWVDKVTVVRNCDDAADCNDNLFCTGVETCVAGVCVDGSGEPCAENETCDEATDQCLTNSCNVQWDFDEDCDVDKDDATLLGAQQKAEKTALKSRHTAEKAGMKAALGSAGVCDAEMDLDEDCDVDKDDSSLLKIRQKTEKTALAERHKAEKAAMKAAL